MAKMHQRLENHQNIRQISDFYRLGEMALNGRSERIRTSDPLIPNQVRYQAALRSVPLVEGLIASPFHNGKRLKDNFLFVG